jgi:ribosome-associated translation inhibitor RaiA
MSFRMNIDIQTEHLAMRPEWHQQIEDWVGRCRLNHPDVAGIDLTLRCVVDDARRPRQEVDAVVTTRGRRAVHAARRAHLMTVALHDALEAIESELLVDEALRRRA